MSETSERRTSVPTRTIHEAYRACMEARWEYIRSRKFGGADQQATHQRLHDAVQEYFEALYELLVSEPAAEKYWEGTEDHYLYAFRETVVDTKDGQTVRVDDLANVSDEVVDAAYQRKRYAGLQALENQFERSSPVVRQYQGSLRSHSWVEERPDALDPALLFRAARQLNQAAKDLGFIAEPETPDETDPEPI